MNHVQGTWPRQRSIFTPTAGWGTGDQTLENTSSCSILRPPSLRKLSLGLTLEEKPWGHWRVNSEARAKILTTGTHNASISSYSQYIIFCLRCFLLHFLMIITEGLQSYASACLQAEQSLRTACFPDSTSATTVHQNLSALVPLILCLESYLLFMVYAFY